MNNFIAGLDRIKPRTIPTVLEWAEKNYFINNQPFSLKGREYLRELLDKTYEDEPLDITAMKSSQCGVSELAVLISYYFMDVYQQNVFYGFPNQDLIGQFVQSRIQPRINDSTYLSAQFSNVDNIKLKQMGRAFMFLRGTNTQGQIKSADVEFVIWDELDEMKQAHVPILERRLGDSELKKYRWKLKLSTPTFPDYGIHWEYKKTDQRQYWQRCDACGKDQVLDFFKNITPEPTREMREPDFEPRYICAHCGSNFDNKKPGRWIAQYPNKPSKGYHISKLFSEKAGVLWRQYRDCKDEFEVEAFYNHDLGIPYAQNGAKLTEAALLACISEYKREGIRSDIYMGVDVGKGLNVTIAHKSDKNNLIAALVVSNFEELDTFMHKYDINLCIIDALPETRKAREFQSRFPGRVLLCFYNLSDQGKNFEINNDEGKVRANRSNVMERLMNNVNTRKWRFYPEIKDNTSFKEQMTAPQKVQVKNDKTGNVHYEFLEGNKPDHYYHSMTYLDMAMDNATPVCVDVPEVINESDNYTDYDYADYGSYEYSSSF